MGRVFWCYVTLGWTPLYGDLSKSAAPALVNRTTTLIMCVCVWGGGGGVMMVMGWGVGGGVKGEGVVK